MTDFPLNADVWFPEEKPPEPVIAKVTAYGARVGTCGEPCDVISVGISRVMSIMDLLVRFDGERDGWSIGRIKWIDIDADKWEFLELAFVDNGDLEWPESELTPLSPASVVGGTVAAVESTGDADAGELLESP